MPKIQLSGGAYQARSVIASAQRCLNLFAEPMPQVQGEPSQFAYYPTPGLTLLGALPKGPVRALKQVTTGGVYAVGGDTVYQVDGDWSSTALGTISPGRPYPVSMQDNGNTLVIVDGTPGGWTVDLASNAFAPISDPAFYGADRVDYLDTYFVLNKPNTPQFYISGSLAVTWDSLDFANKESFSDLLVNIAVAKREIWLLGDRTTEVWYNAGVSSISDFTFQQVQGTFVDQGCVAKYSVATYDDAVYWLGGNRAGQGIVLKGAGYQYSRISTFAIENELANYPRIDDAIGFTYLLAGHIFYVLTFPHADRTWAYDIATQQWHEWLWIDDNGEEHRHRLNCAYAINGMVVGGDWQNGNLYAVETTALTDNGQPIKRQRSFPHIINQMNRVFYRQFIADIETGNPGATPAPSPPAPSLSAGFTALPLAPGGLRGGAYAVSADGHTVVGYVDPVAGDDTSGPRAACYWVDGAGPTIIGADFSEAYGVSGDGSVIVGDTNTQPFIWTAATGFQSFAAPDDAVWAISADGATIVGSSDASGNIEACYWDRSGIRTDLGFLPGHDRSEALAASADGACIVGYSELTSSANSQRAFRWTAAGGMVDLGVAGDALRSSATGVSDDGATVSINQAGGSATSGAAIWSMTGGLALLPSVPGVVSSNFATGMSGDGTTTIGTSDLVVSGVGTNTENLATWTSAGIVVLPGNLDPVDHPGSYSLIDAKGVSHDGSVIVGTSHGYDYLPWVFQAGAVPPPAVPHPPPGTQVFLDWSDDRGHSFGNPVGHAIGETGRYLTVAQWQRLGYARDRVFRLTWSVPVATALQGAFIEVDTSAKS